MITIVIKDKTLSKEEIETRIEEFRKGHNIVGTFEEGIDYEIKFFDELEDKSILEMEIDYKPFHLSEPKYELWPKPTKTEICQGRTQKQKKNQDKWAKRFSNRYKI